MSYVIAGRKIAPEYLSIATLTTFFGGVAYAMSGKSPKQAGMFIIERADLDALKKEMPPIESSSSDEESFILYE